jgi:hypothetical protein
MNQIRKWKLTFECFILFHICFILHNGLIGILTNQLRTMTKTETKLNQRYEDSYSFYVDSYCHLQSHQASASLFHPW